MNAKTKEKLLEVAKSIIDFGGIEALSMRELGKMAGLSRSAIYRHYNDKEDLLATITANNFTMLSNMVSKLEEKLDNPRQLIFQILLQYYQYGISNSQFYKLMFNYKWDKKKYPEIQKEAFSIFTKIVTFVTSIQLNKDEALSLKKTAIIYAFIHGLVELHLTDHTEVSKGLDNAESLINLMLDGILGN